MADNPPVMPYFDSGFHGFHHTVDSALRVLSTLGLPASRVTLRMAGRGWPPRWVVSQEPRPGTRLTDDVEVHLSISGLGYFDDLPVGMWDQGGEDEPGTREILEPVDDPLQKAAHWIREGAELFDIRPGHLEACSRWISLFGLSADDWPPEAWYSLSLLLPRIQNLADTAEGIRLAFQVLAHLSVNEISFFKCSRLMPEDEWSLLGERSCRLGVDTILGNRLEDLAGVCIVVGPVPLFVYKEFHRDENKQLITNILGLSLSCQRECRVTWLVEDRKRAPRLGFEKQNGRLGINSYLGRRTGIGSDD
jgi:hypothetical protein